MYNFVSNASKKKKLQYLEASECIPMPSIQFYTFGSSPFFKRVVSTDDDYSLLVYRVPKMPLLHFYYFSCLFHSRLFDVVKIVWFLLK